MDWVFTGLLLGSLVTSQHASEEACEGRRAMLAKKEVVGQCNKPQGTGALVFGGSSGGRILQLPGGWVQSN